MFHSQLYPLHQTVGILVCDTSELENENYVIINPIVSDYFFDNQDDPLWLLGDDDDDFDVFDDDNQLLMMPLILMNDDKLMIMMYVIMHFLMNALEKCIF